MIDGCNADAFAYNVGSRICQISFELRWRDVL